MKRITSTEEVDELLSRSISAVYPNKAALRRALMNGKRLTFYVGIDPTAHYVHLGHSTNYLILGRLHDLGHRIVVLVGDFTATIGDPSDKTAARVQLTRKQVEDNLKTFKRQIGKILDFESTTNPIEFVFNSNWLASLTFRDAVELASNFTVQQMIERDAFQRRLKENKPLYLHEFFYPLMQGYDSVALDVDGEIGGTDQTFNMLAGRTLLKRYINKEKFVITTTLLENPMTGEKLMSKSLGTGIGLDEPPRDMFLKVMQLPDAGMIQCFTDCTRLSLREIDVLKRQLETGGNPRDIKLRLADEIVSMYHSAEEAKAALSWWLATVSGRKLQDDITKHPLKKRETYDLVELLVELDFADSKSSARRLLEQGGVSINGRKIAALTFPLSSGDILRAGKKHAVQILVG